jgi:TPR repeat protein
MFGRACALAASNRGFVAAKMGVTEMGKAWIDATDIEGAAEASGCGEDMLVATCLAAAANGDIDAYFDLGVAYSTGSHGVGCDLIEAHKWFNLAAVAGHDEAQWCRADISEEMNVREIAEAQRRAREWLSATSRKAA